MTLFRANRTHWASSCPSVPPRAADTASADTDSNFNTQHNSDRKGGGKNDEDFATAGSVAFETSGRDEEEESSPSSSVSLSSLLPKQATTDGAEKGFRNKNFMVALTTDAIRTMVDTASTASNCSESNVHRATDEDKNGTLVSTGRASAGPFVLRLCKLEKRKRRFDDNGSIDINIDDDDDDDGDGNCKNEKERTKDAVVFDASVTDGTKSCLGKILERNDGRLENLSECIISISEYVMKSESFSENQFRAETSSEVTNGKDIKSDDRKNQKEEEDDDDETNSSKVPRPASNAATRQPPCIFITRYELLYEKRLHKEEKNDDFNTNDNMQRSVEEEDKQTKTKQHIILPRGPQGKLAALLSSSKLRIDDFIGDEQINHCRLESKMGSGGKLKEDALKISHFIEQHSAIMALKRNNENAPTPSLSSPSFSFIPDSPKYFQNYTRAVNEFDKNQRENQFTCLSDWMEECASVHDCGSAEDNAESQTAFREEQSWIQYIETLEYALNCKDEAISSELLLRWHAWLVGDGLEQEAGSFASDARPERVGEFCTTLEQRWFSPQTNEASANPMRVASFAAVAILGLLDILPFDVGNQRLARILLNWALRRAGLPFCITLYSNEEEKFEYFFALQSTRRNLRLATRGCTEVAEMATKLRTSGGLAPLVGHILDRIVRATADLSVLFQTKSLLASEETDARLVRLAREKAAEGSCIICFEDKPNIATLCCGKPVHFNCLAEWLRSHSTCPQCRSNLPSLSSRRMSHRHRDDRMVDYDHDRISIRNFRSDEIFFRSSSSSSSSEDSPSSSSSSSDESSTFFYRGLNYGANDTPLVGNTYDDDDDDDESRPSVISLLGVRSDAPTPFTSPPRYVTTGGEERHNYVSDNDEESGPSTYESPYQSLSDDDVDSYSFSTNDSISVAIYASNLELRGNDDMISVSYSQSEGDRYALLNEDNSDNSETFSDRSDENFARETSTRTHIRVSNVNPEYHTPFRMSFLDPEILGNIQAVDSPRFRRRRLTSSVSGENSHDDDGNDARPAFLRETDDVHPFCMYSFEQARRDRWA